MAYPEASLEKVTDGRQVRFASTDDFLNIAEAASGAKLDWFFEVYLRQPKLPRLVSETTNSQVTLRWEVPDGLPFPMPVDVQIGDSTKRYEVPQGGAVVPIQSGQKVVIDPQGWILKKIDQ
jgi:aminopeptidase N